MSGHPEQKSPELCVKKCPAGMHPSLPHPIEREVTLTEEWKASVVTRGLFQEVHSKKFVCKLPGCVHKNGNKNEFTRKNDIFRHINEKEFAETPRFECGYKSCNHRAKQAAHIAQHVNSKHAPDELKVWHWCKQEGCEARFLDPSSLSVHNTKVHKKGKCTSGSTTPRQRASATPTERIAPAEETRLGVEGAAAGDEDEDEDAQLYRLLRQELDSLVEHPMPNREDDGPQGQITPDSTSHDALNPGHGRQTSPGYIYLGYVPATAANSTSYGLKHPEHRPQTPPALTYSPGELTPTSVETGQYTPADHDTGSLEAPNAPATDNYDPPDMDWTADNGISGFAWETVAKESGLDWDM